MSIFNGSNAKLVDQVEEWFRYSRDNLSKYRKRIREDFEFYSGKQWSPEDVQKLRESRRPVVTFNRVAPTIDAVAGTEIVNRQETRYLPRTTQPSEDDGPVSEMYTSVAMWIRDMTDAEDEESEAYLDCLVSGIGWTETWLDTDDDPDGKIRIEHINNMEMLWDPDATKRNLRDTRYRMRWRQMARSEIKQRWPNARLRLGTGFERMDLPSEPHDADDAKFYINDASKKQTNPNTIPVIQVQWWEKVPMYRAFNPTTEATEELTQDELTVAREMVPDLDFVKYTRRKFFQAFISGKTVLEKHELHGGDVPGFTLHPITGKRDLDGMWAGLLRGMKDPQRWSNKFFAQITDIMNSQAKGGILAEKGAFDNQRKAEEDWTKPDAIVWAADGALTQNRIQERKGAGVPNSVDRMMATAIHAVRDASGVNVEFLGSAERTQSGVVEGGRIRQGMTVLAVFFNSLRQYRKEQGRVLLHFINRYISDGEAVRVVGEDRFVAFRKDPDARKYDIIVDQSPTSANMKQEVWQAMQQILPALIKSGAPVPVQEVLEFSPLPPSVVSRIKKFYESQGPSESERAAAEQETALNLAKLAAEIRNIEGGTEEKRAKAASNVRARENDANKTILDAVRLLDELTDNNKGKDE